MLLSSTHLIPTVTLCKGTIRISVFTDEAMKAQRGKVTSDTQPGHTYLSHAEALRMLRRLHMWYQSLLLPAFHHPQTQNSVLCSL